MNCRLNLPASVSTERDARTRTRWVHGITVLGVCAFVLCIYSVLVGGRGEQGGMGGVSGWYNHTVGAIAIACDQFMGSQ